MYVRIGLVMIVMDLTLTACQMSAGDAAMSRDGLAEGVPPEQAAGEAGIAPGEAGAPASAPCSAGVWSGDYVVRNQAELDALAGYTEVTGHLRIDDSDIVHLSGPGCLAAVGGNVRVYDNAWLASVSGFDGLRAVGGSLQVLENRRLTAIAGFDELRTITGNLTFDSNGVETAIQGFDELRTIAGGLTFDNGHYQVFGFDELELVEGTLQAWNGNGPEGKNITIHGLSELSTVGSMRFEGMGRVALDGLVDLERVNGNVVFDNCLVVDTTGLRDLSRIDGDLLLYFDDYYDPSILDLPDLEHIDGHFVIENGAVELGAFSELEFVGGDLRCDASVVPEIVGFEDLEVIGGSFEITECAIERLVAFNDLREVGGNLRLDEVEDESIELEIFDELESIGGALQLEETNLLTLSIFDDLVSIGGDLFLHRNRNLQTLGLPDLELLGGDSLVIDRNEALSTCAAEALLERLQENGFAGAANITGNGACQ
jgi:hypothetical protein